MSRRASERATQYGLGDDLMMDSTMHYMQGNKCIGSICSVRLVPDEQDSTPQEWEATPAPEHTRELGEPEGIRNSQDGREIRR
ncbi:hypothetical protein PG993_012783 [Apiospora rasikravindrae]|uniref:Uncharacterized protein n=1 Tax=Apiospora rasikravindrae TaxID=990691 RepID=A0ABR1RVR9_9PEZI